MENDNTSPDLSRESQPLPDNAASIGAWFQSQRMRRNKSVDDLVRQTKYSRRALTALENNDWEQLPTGFSLRAMTKRYAEALGLDQEEAMQRLEKEQAGAAYRPANSSHMVSSLDHELSPVKTETIKGQGGGWLRNLFLIIVLALVLFMLAVALGIIDPSGTPLEFLNQYLHRN